MLEVMDYTAEKTDYQRKHEEISTQTATKKRKGIGLAIGHRAAAWARKPRCLRRHGHRQ